MNMEQQSGGITLNVDRLNTDTAVVQMAGYLDTYNSMGVQNQVNQIIRGGVNNLVFDLKKLTYISSTGIVVFTNTLKQVRKTGGNIILSEMASRVSDVLQLLGFSTFFTTTETLEEAMAYLPSVPKIDIPFSELEALTTSFREIEVFVEPEKQPEFYTTLLKILKQVEEIKQ